MSSLKWNLVAWILLGAITAGPATTVAQTKADQKPDLTELLNRLRKVERELEQLKAKNGQVPAKAKDQKIHVLLETPYLGSTSFGSTSSVRFFAARLIFVNLTPKPVTISRDQIELQADGQTHKLGDVPAKIQFNSFQVGNQSFQLQSLKPAKQLKLPAGGTAATWAVFSDLDRGTEIPKLVFKFNIAGLKTELNVNEFALGLLELKVQRIGPRGSLGLLTISGSMNTVNIGSLTEALDRLSADKVARAVIRWSSSAAPLDSNLATALQQAAVQAGRGGVTNNRLPTIPAFIRELHLAELPNQTTISSYGSLASPPRIHKTAVAAVSAALKSAYQVVPRDELLAEIERGHPLTRAAALAVGGGRLSVEHLPRILKYADEANPQMQRAALQALRHFGEQPAVDKLVHFVRKNAEPLSSVALESLASSRYSSAHRALLEVVKNEPPASKKTIVAVLAKYPRPIWSQTIYDFVQDSDSEIVLDALRALARIGHPKLLEVLEQSLARNNPALKNEAFKILAARTDPKSEALAVNFMLEHLKKAPPELPEMYALLTRTKDRRALPLLLKHFDRSNSNRSNIITALAALGDQETAAVFVKHYPKLSNSEKSTVLGVLLQMKSPAFRKLAGQALRSSYSPLISTACRGLQADGSSEAVELLAAALESSRNTTTWSYVTNALSTLATPEAKTALRKARESGNSQKRNYANNALRNLRRRSPGYQYVSQAESYLKQNKIKDALARYDIALELDPQLPEAHSGRGNLFLRQNKPQEAHKNFAKALELDPYNSQAVSGMGIALVMEGKSDAGIKFVEDARGKFKNDLLFAYNAACTYGRALEYLDKHQDVADRDQKIIAYRKQALADLKHSVKLGYRDLTWMKKDPDLNSLHDLPEFKQISETQPAAGQK